MAVFADRCHTDTRAVRVEMTGRTSMLFHKLSGYSALWTWFLYPDH